MEDHETLLAMAKRHVREGEAYLRRQRNLVQDLKTTQSPLEDKAQVLLTTCKFSQNTSMTFSLYGAIVPAIYCRSNTASLCVTLSFWPPTRLNYLRSPRCVCSLLPTMVIAFGCTKIISSQISLQMSFARLANRCI